jgi:hypothetical protein
VNPRRSAAGTLTAPWACGGVAVVGAALLLGFGVTPWELCRYAAYEVFLVGLPGVLVYRALARDPGTILRQVAIGWPLGCVIEIGAFALTATLDLRDLFPAVPLLVAGVAALWLHRSKRQGDRRHASEIPLPPAAAWSVAAVVALALSYLAVGYFTQTPLPHDTASVSYPPDNVWDIGLVAEAKHHWPMQSPSVSGEPFRYQIFVFVHMAAVSQVTGIEPSTILFRLFPAGLISLVAVGVAALGRRFGPSPWVGPLAVALVLLVGELDLLPEQATPFASPFFDDLALSPTFLFGIPPFLAVTTLVLTFVESEQRPSLGELALLAALMVGCAGAKGSILPVVLGGLVLLLGWNWLRRRDLPRSLLAVLAMAVAVFGLIYVLLYSGGGNAGFGLDVFDFTHFTVFDGLVNPGSRGPVGDFLLTGAIGSLSLVAMLLPTLGIIWVLARPGSLEPGEAWLLATFAAGLGAFLLLSQPGESQIYFLYYGYIAACVVSARGILSALGRAQAGRERSLRATGGMVAAALAVGGAAAVVLYVRGSATAGLGRLAIGYGLAALAILVLAKVALRLSGRNLRILEAALLLTICLGLLNTPIDAGVPAVEDLAAGRPLHPTDQPEQQGMTDGLRDGLTWLRQHSGPNDVIAVNNHTLDRDGFDSRYFYYSAFAERRVFLESWLYTSDADEIGDARVAAGEELPFPNRQGLNTAVFEGDREAARRLASDYGVRYLLVDRLHAPAGGLGRLGLGPPVFQNQAVAIYRLEPNALRAGS